MAQKLELKIEWYSNEHYYLDNVTLLLTDEKIEAIEKSQALMKANPEIDTIRVRIDQDCIATMSETYVLGYGFVLVSSSDALYFIGTDHHNSQWQVETESFELDKPLFEYVTVCDECQGENVQTKAWVRPNKNNEYVDMASEEIQDNYCDDCEENVSTSVIKKELK